MLKFSKLNKTWIIDIDGTIVKHYGYKTDGYDTLLEGVTEFFTEISPDDKVIFLTARKAESLNQLKEFLELNNIRYDHILTDLPTGERILINDKKPSGLNTAFAINKTRDEKLKIEYTIDESL